jgi:hypothetical protein
MENRKKYHVAWTKHLLYHEKYETHEGVGRMG